VTVTAQAVQVQLEERLLQRIQAGDDGAFDRLVELCAPRVLALAFRMVGNHEDAQDIAQEAFVRVYQALPRFRKDAAFSTWLYRIVLNVCHDELARRGRRPLVASEMMTDDAASTPFDAQASGETPEDAYLRTERQQVIQQALLTLPEIFRAVVLLHDVQGLSYEEMSGVLRVELGTVKSRLHRARTLLREKIRAGQELFPVEGRQNP
jgi:RNA polymerase sigma-70 factor (ECF subfamily)